MSVWEGSLNQTYNDEYHFMFCLQPWVKMKSQHFLWGVEGYCTSDTAATAMLL